MLQGKENSSIVFCNQDTILKLLEESLQPETFYIWSRCLTNNFFFSYRQETTHFSSFHLSKWCMSLLNNSVDPWSRLPKPALNDSWHVLSHLTPKHRIHCWNSTPSLYHTKVCLMSCPVSVEPPRLVYPCVSTETDAIWTECQQKYSRNRKQKRGEKKIREGCSSNEQATLWKWCYLGMGYALTTSQVVKAYLLVIITREVPITFFVPQSFKFEYFQLYICFVPDYQRLSKITATHVA